jgi:hypothetical protein
LGAGGGGALGSPPGGFSRGVGGGGRLAEGQPAEGGAAGGRLAGRGRNSMVVPVRIPGELALAPLVVTQLDSAAAVRQVRGHPLERAVRESR